MKEPLVSLFVLFSSWYAIDIGTHAEPLILMSTAPPKRPLRFSMYAFEPRPWERKRIHSYSVHAPLWWRSWVKLRTLGAKVGIG
jgi:hypothetical protein